MRNSDLIAALSRLPADAEIVLAADAEGNSFDRVREVEELDVVEVGYRDETIEDAVVLWP